MTVLGIGSFHYCSMSWCHHAPKEHRNKEQDSREGPSRKKVNDSAKWPIEQMSEPFCDHRKIILHLCKSHLSHPSESCLRCMPCAESNMQWYVGRNQVWECILVIAGQSRNICRLPSGPGMWPGEEKSTKQGMPFTAIYISCTHDWSKYLHIVWTIYWQQMQKEKCASVQQNVGFNSRTPCLKITTMQ